MCVCSCAVNSTFQCSYNYYKGFFCECKCNYITVQLLRCHLMLIYNNVRPIPTLLMDESINEFIVHLIFFNG